MAQFEGDELNSRPGAPAATLVRMVAELRNRSRTTWYAFLTVTGLGVIAAWWSVTLSGTKTGAVLPAIVTLAPVLLYAGLLAPLVFPFSTYVVAVPLDEILTIPSFGTLERLIGILTAVALLFYMLRTKRFVDPSRWLASWVLLYLWMGASLLWAMDVAKSVEMILTALQLLALYVVVSMFPITFKQLTGVLYAVIAGGAIAAGYALYLFSTGVSIQSRLAIAAENSAGDPNHFAASLVVPLGAAVYLILWNRSTLIRFSMICLSGLMVGAILLSGSRGAIVGVAVLLGFILLRDPNRRFLYWLVGALAVMGALIAGPSLYNRFVEAAVNGGAGRADIWHVGLLAFTQNWLFGAGYENFPFAYDKAYIHVFQPFFTNWHRAPHNLLLGTAVDLGIIGLAFMLIAWFGQFKTLSFIDAMDRRFGLRITLQGCVVAMFVIAMFSDIMARKYIWLLFMLIALTRNARTEPGANA